MRTIGLKVEQPVKAQPPKEAPVKKGDREKEAPVKKETEKKK